MLSKYEQDFLDGLDNSDILDHITDYVNVDRYNSEEIIEHLVDEWRRQSFADFDFKTLFDRMGVKVESKV